MNIESEPRVGDAERDDAVASLGDHFAAGRLSREEFDERSDVAARARTQSQLTRLFADLPRAAVPAAAAPMSYRPRLRVPWVPFVVVFAALGLISHGAVLPLAILAWLWFFGPLRLSRSRHERWHGAQYGSSR